MVTIGTGATIHIGPDMYPATIVDIGTKSFTVQQDLATLKPGRLANERQVYDIFRNHLAAREEYTIRADGSYKLKGSSSQKLTIGVRRAFRA
jgi:hypothetical protein